jgi:hypothetical protein
MDAMKTPLLVAAALLVPAVAHGNPRCKVSTAPADAFKDVTGAKADDGTVVAVTRPEGELLLGTWTAGKHHHATAAYVVVKKGERCAGPIIELGDTFTVQGLVDLDAEAQLWSSGRWSLLALDDAKASHPAVLLSLAGKNNTTELALLSVPPDAGRLLVRELFSEPGLEVLSVSTTGDTKPRDLDITATATPHPGDQNPRPGPPVHRTRHWKNGAYETK